MADQFKLGDTVQLKSGGPVMTVTYVGSLNPGSKPSVSCSWFDEKNQQQHGRWPAEALKHAEPA